MLLLQEHWLSESQLVELGHINPRYFYHGICGFDNSDILLGRPYGGCAIFWRSDIVAVVETVNTGSRRLCCIRMSSDTWRLLIVNVYLPYEDDDNSSDEFMVQLSNIEYLINQHADCHVIIGGDFNVDFYRHRSHTDLLTNFCERMTMTPSVRHTNYRVDYTYHFNMNRFNTLDHFIVSECLFNSICLVDVIHDGVNLSDHDPLVMQISLNSEFLTFKAKLHVQRLAWYQANEDKLNDYKLRLEYFLRGIDVPVDALTCRDLMCRDADHFHKLNLYAKDISTACRTAADLSIPHTGTSSHEGRCVPGWSEYVEPEREKSIFWHRIWMDCGRPKTGTVADIMRRTRALYHYAVRRVKRDEQELVRQRFADALLSSDNRDLWSEVKKINGKKALPAGVVDGLSTPESISEFFAHKYQVLYSSVPYNLQDLQSKRDIIDSRILEDGYSKDCVVTADEVASVINRLKPNKQDGNEGLSSNHFRNAGLQLHVHTSCLFSGMLGHGYVPDDFLLSTALPIPKGRNSNLTDSANYRGIALSSIFGKILDLIILRRYSENLASCDLQFGFKPKRSTTMCSMILKEVISFYVNNNSSVNCVFLDASKAFDRVEYGKLFQLLLDRNLPSPILRLLLNMYTDQQVRVLWNGVFSLPFSVLNGVKQGAIISPILFCVYLDVLLEKLRDAGVGCYIAGCFVGALAYADDLVLLTPSASAMRRMLLICDRFSTEYNVSFNVNKTKCLNFRPSKYTPSKESPLPSFSLGGNIIENVCQWPHLGHVINIQCSDSTDIIERKNSFTGQVNNMLCHFAKLDSLVKCRLFNAYCSSFYGSELWNLDNSEIDSFCVAWRKGMRRVWGLPVDTSSDTVYLIADSIPIYDELCRRFINFLRSALDCGCRLVERVVKHALCISPMKSPLGRNAVTCSLRYGVSHDSIHMFQFSKQYFRDRWISELAPDATVRTSFLLELLFIRDGLLYLPKSFFTREHLQTLINSIVETRINY